MQGRQLYVFATVQELFLGSFCDIIYNYFNDRVLIYMDERVDG